MCVSKISKLQIDIKFDNFLQPVLFLFSDKVITSGPKICHFVVREICSYFWFSSKWNTRASEVSSDTQVPKWNILSLEMLDIRHIWDTLYFICNEQMDIQTDWVQSRVKAKSIVLHFSTPLYVIAKKGWEVPLYNRDSSPEEQQHQSFVRKCKTIFLFYWEVTSWGCLNTDRLLLVAYVSIQFLAICYPVAKALEEEAGLSDFCLGELFMSLIEDYTHASYHNGHKIHDTRLRWTCGVVWNDTDHCSLGNMWFYFLY